MNRKIIYYILCLISIGCLILFGYNIIKNKKMTKDYEQTKKIVTNIQEVNKIEELQKKYNNNDVKGFFKVENTDIEDVLVQGDNNSYYLSHLPNKKYNSFGSVFIDYRNNILSDYKINIYGHTSRKKDTTLSKFERYLNKDYFNKNKKIILQNEKEEEIYNIFSIQIVDNDKHMKLNYTKEEWTEYLNNLKENSKYYTNIDNIKNKKIITFQTCIYLEKKKLLLINAVKI